MRPTKYDLHTSAWSTYQAEMGLQWKLLAGNFLYSSSQYRPVMAAFHEGEFAKELIPGVMNRFPAFASWPAFTYGSFFVAPQDAVRNTIEN